MSLTGRFDSVFSIFRGTNATDAFGDAAYINPTLVAEFDGLMTSPHDPWLDEKGAGEHPRGYRTIIFEDDVDVQDNDIIFVREGPEVDTWWRLQYLMSPHGRHKEGYVVPYYGPKVDLNV